jgi:hypothetical protein
MIICVYSTWRRRIYITFIFRGCLKKDTTKMWKQGYVSISSMQIHYSHCWYFLSFFQNMLNIDSIYVKFIEYILMISYFSHICNYSLTNNIQYVMWGYVTIHLVIQFHMVTILQTTKKILRYTNIFWYITPRSLWEINRHFGGTCSLHLPSWEVSQERNQEVDRSDMFSETSANTELTTQRRIPEDK